jgi:hypothetical protein
MRVRISSRPFALPLLAAGLLCASVPAVAEDIQCSSLPNPVYGIGGSAQKPTVGDFAEVFRNAADPFTLIYQSPGACFAMSALIDGVPITGSASFWNADGTEGTCVLPLTGVPADYGIMGNVPTTCPGVEGLPEGAAQFDGAVLGWNIIVPVASTQQSISSEALYFVYGFGPEGQAAPWTDGAQINSRSGTSAAGIAVASAAGLPVERLFPNDVRTNGAMVTNLAASTNPEAAIGFVSGDVADRSRAQVRTLAYQHRGQDCGYWPDSSATAFDKAGIRFGQYWLWTSTFYYAPVNAEGRPLNANAARFIDFATGLTPPTAEIPAFEILVEGGNIPRCAMHVTRSGDYTALQPYAASEPCDCYYESIAVGSTDCTVCDDNSDCGTDAPVCRFGFCEVR